MASSPSKHGWLVPAGSAVPLFSLIAAGLFVREALECARLGQAAAAQGWGISALALLAVGSFFGWGLATVVVQDLTDRGVQALTLRRGRVFLPWSAVQRVSWRDRGARVVAGPISLWIGFTMYRDPDAAATYVRSRMPSSAGTPG